MKAEKAEALGRALRPIQVAPVLWRIIGTGSAMLGRHFDRDVLPHYYAVLWLTFLFIPVIPLAIYLVTHPGMPDNPNPSVTQFRASISAGDFSAIYPGGIGKLFRSSMFEGALWLAVVIAIVGGVAIVVTLIPRGSR